MYVNYQTDKKLEEKELKITILHTIFDLPIRFNFNIEFLSIDIDSVNKNQLSASANAANIIFDGMYLLKI